MRIEYPRAPRQVKTARGIKYAVGHAQFEALKLLERYGGTAKAPDGSITSTGVVRPHVFNDMVPIGLASLEVKQPGVVNYNITALGKKVRRNAIVQKAPRRRYRGRADGRKAAQRKAA